MIKLLTIQYAMYETMRKAVTLIPPDIEFFLKKVLEEEMEPLARKHLEVTLKNILLASQGKGLVCGDTGFPLYFITAGSNTEIEGGFGSLWEAAKKAIFKATEKSFLRPTMVDPLTRENPGTNLGPGMPKIELIFMDKNDGLEIIAVPKGGGSEIFGTFYRMMYPSDGETGIMKFVVESIYDGCYAGKICPPAIIGVGIGGTADMCMQLAKKAAVLRSLGTHNPDTQIAKMERKLFCAIRQLGLGPMGSKGINAVMGIHIETAVTHTAALPVAVNTQCSVGRRWKASITAQGKVSFTGDLNAR